MGASASKGSGIPEIKQGSIGRKAVLRQKLTEEIKFWKVLSRKFDQLEYEFNVSSTLCRTNGPRIYWLSCEDSSELSRNSDRFLKSFQRSRNKSQGSRLQSKYKKYLAQKLYLQLQEIVAGFVSKLEQCSDICESVGLLRKILIGFEAIGQEN